MVVFKISKNFYIIHKSRNIIHRKLCSIIIFKNFYIIHRKAEICSIIILMWIGAYFFHFTEKKFWNTREERQLLLCVSCMFYTSNHQSHPIKYSTNPVTIELLDVCFLCNIYINVYNNYTKTYTI